MGEQCWLYEWTVFSLLVNDAQFIDEQCRVYEWTMFSFWVNDA